MIERLRGEIPRLMSRAEELFGPREPGWEAPELHQMAQGPMAVAAVQPSRVLIFLNSVILSFDQGLYQLSHEIVHALGHNNQTEANMLEEGAAVWFSLYGHEYPMQGYLAAAEYRLSAPDGPTNYFDALKLYNEMNAVHPGAVRKIRQADPRLDRQTPASLRQLLPEISQDLAGRLCERRGMRP